MRNFSPQRRAAVLCAAGAAIIPALLVSSHRSDTAAHYYGLLGTAVGLVIGVSIVMLRKARRAC
jgi:peptidoglycan/LPS O-acetylase OafA/YrhL